MDTVEQIKSLVEILEILKKPVAERNQEESREVVTILLLRFMDVFDHDKKIVQATLPAIETLKNHITAADYDTAFVHIHALLWRFREVRFPLSR